MNEQNNNVMGLGEFATRPCRSRIIGVALTTIALLFLSLVTLSAGAQEKPSYSITVEAIFRDRCMGCHNDKQSDGGLSVESLNSLMKGGRSGQIVVPGKSSESLLVKRIDGTVLPVMPLRTATLPVREVKVIKAWIDSMPDSTTTAPKAASPKGDSESAGPLISSSKQK